MTRRKAFRIFNLPSWAASVSVWKMVVLALWCTCLIILIRGMDRNFLPSHGFPFMALQNDVEGKRPPTAFVGPGFSPIGASRVQLLNKPNVMVNLSEKRVFNQTLCPVEPHEPERASSVAFLKFFTFVFANMHDNLPWWLDEGSLIGVGRAGATKNADDDFDFFVLLPNTTSPCRAGSLECTDEEFKLAIYRLLLPIWNNGACIRKFNPDFDKFSPGRHLIYTIVLPQNWEKNSLRCPKNLPVAHLHLGVLNRHGELETNKWYPPKTHPKDKLPLDIILPVRRCRMGLLDAPCPNKIADYLMMRNEREYSSRSSDGRCLLVKKNWNLSLKMEQLRRVQLLHDCGYNSMVNLVQPFVQSGFRRC